MPTPEQIFCWFVAILLVVVALRFLVKEKLSFALVLCLCAIGFAFFGLSGVQGLLKTGLLLTVKDSLVKYGEKLEGFQTNGASMRAELGEHQTLIDKHQQELKDQQALLRTTQTNITGQQEKLSDVTYWVKNLYANTENETIYTSDTNRVLVSQVTNYGFCVCIKLKHPPIRESIQGSVLAPELMFVPIQFEKPNLAYRNLFVTALPLYKNIRSTQLRIQYVKDTRLTNVTEDVEVRGSEFYLGGISFVHCDTNAIYLRDLSALDHR